jgi:hypothetical protein
MPGGRVEVFFRGRRTLAAAVEELDDSGGVPASRRRPRHLELPGARAASGEFGERTATGVSDGCQLEVALSGAVGCSSVTARPAAMPRRPEVVSSGIGLSSPVSRHRVTWVCQECPMP